MKKLFSFIVLAAFLACSTVEKKDETSQQTNQKPKKPTKEEMCKDKDSDPVKKMLCE